MHACINCDGDCFCHGDIDDCQVERPEYSYARCTGCGCLEDIADDVDYCEQEE
jgi:hypothetical protein